MRKFAVAFSCIACAGYSAQAAPSKVAEVADSSHDAQKLANLLLAFNSATAFAGGRVPAGPSSRSPSVQMQAQTIESLLAENRAAVDSLASIAPVPELTLLRYSLAFPEKADAEKALKEALEWRNAEGRKIVDVAKEAVAKAIAGGGWDNAPVAEAAPHAATIGKFISPKNILTMSAEDGALLYVIRAADINDKELMDELSVEQVAEFFAYAKEVHSIVADARSKELGRLIQVNVANDLAGVRKPFDSRFQKALTGSSQQYEKLYPNLVGPTMILNLPFVLQAFANLLKPLFPKSVRARLKFQSAPTLAKVTDLTEFTNDKDKRASFLGEIKQLLTKF